MTSIANPTASVSNSNTNKHPQDSAVEMTELVLPQHTNALGSVFGGTVMAWIDIAAAISAMKHSRSQVVTASIDALHFIAPVRLGHVISLHACVNATGSTSMEVGVRVDSEDPRTGVKTHTATAYVTFVALDEKGQPQKVPVLVPVTDAEKRRHAAALKRRASRGLGFDRDSIQFEILLRSLYESLVFNYCACARPRRFKARKITIKSKIRN
jgi:acyl-CoA hydrolase